MTQSRYRRAVTVVHSLTSWLEQTQTWMFSQLASLPADIRCHIVCESTQNLDQFYLPNIHSLDRASKLRIAWDRSLRKLGVREHLQFLSQQARRNSADILHSHFGPMAWANIEVAKQLRLKHVVTFYGYDVNHVPRSDPRWYPRYAELFEHIDLVLCEGPHMAKCIVALGCPDSKVKVHHLGVLLDRVVFQPRTWSAGEPLRVLIAASFREKKGIPYAIEALAQIQHEVRLEITIVGDASRESVQDQEEKQKILGLIAKHELQGKVKLLGFQPHAELLEQAYRHHIYLSPSVTAGSGDTEGGAPVSLIEMAATGMLIVSTVHCDIPEVVQDGVSGLLAKERDVDGLAARLRWLAQNPEAWPRMLGAGRKHVETHFDAVIQAQGQAATYRAMLEPASDLPPRTSLHSARPSLRTRADATEVDRY
ncbi:MAG: glycosyltransferase [Betaproteobacteria bacterium]